MFVFVAELSYAIHHPSFPVVQYCTEVLRNKYERVDPLRWEVGDPLRWEVGVVSHVMYMVVRDWDFRKVGGEGRVEGKRGS